MKATTAATRRGRFAPSPTGPLHAGSLVAALASWLDARHAGGRWIVRIEDVDSARCSASAAETILRQLSRCGLVSDEPVLWQSTRGSRYAAALQTLAAEGRVYRCRCSRAEQTRARQEGQVGTRATCPGRCFARGWPLDGPGALRLRLPVDGAGGLWIDWCDRRLGPQRQDVACEVGDFVLRRSDGDWAYQLAVVVDDADQGITDVVRGEDLSDNTARQVVLQRLLGLPSPHWLHTPLVVDAQGRKLSKQNHAPALVLQDEASAVEALSAAGVVLGLAPALRGPQRPAHLADWLAAAVRAWPGADMPTSRPLGSRGSP